MADDDDRQDGDVFNDPDDRPLKIFTAHAITLSYMSTGAAPATQAGISLKQITLSTDLAETAGATAVFRLDNAKSSGNDETPNHPKHDVTFDGDEPLYVILHFK